MNEGTILEPRPDDGGTVLEPVGPIQARLDTGPEERGFRPTIRPPVPRLTILDDGEAATGETLRLRDGVTVIGRTEGQVRLPHDPLVSARHAEIVRSGPTRACEWLLRDAGSSNGTFVRCQRALLRPDRLLVLGGRRFRYRPPGVLVEAAQGDGALEIMLSGTEITLGRPGCGNTVAIDDPLLAARHARFMGDASGGWQIEALPSTNGIWVQVLAVRLTADCRFQVGEQQFLFQV